MGKFATYALRGSSSSGPALPEPLAPVLTVEVADLIQTAGGGADNGGTLQLWSAPAEQGPWTIRATDPWESRKNWGEATAYGNDFLKALEIGNGLQYRGTSTWSNTWEKP